MDETRTSIEIARLRPTQITVGMLQVKHKRKRLRALMRRPSELVDFILEHPIRVVLGPRRQAYVIDHHHLALALMEERFETAPVQVEHDFSTLKTAAFWRVMKAKGFAHPYDADGKEKPQRTIPGCLDELEDDPYRSLAGFVRLAGGFEKVCTPYAEFLWADFYRAHIKKKFLKKDFDKTLKQAITLSRGPEAKKLPGFIKKQAVAK